MYNAWKDFTERLAKIDRDFDDLFFQAGQGKTPPQESALDLMAACQTSLREAREKMTETAQAPTERRVAVFRKAVVPRLEAVGEAFEKVKDIVRANPKDFPPTDPIKDFLWQEEREGGTISNPTHVANVYKFNLRESLLAFKGPFRGLKIGVRELPDRLHDEYNPAARKLARCVELALENVGSALRRVPPEHPFLQPLTEIRDGLGESGACAEETFKGGNETVCLSEAGTSIGLAAQKVGAFYGAHREILGKLMPVYEDWQNRWYDPMSAKDHARCRRVAAKVEAIVKPYEAIQHLLQSIADDESLLPCRQAVEKVAPQAFSSKQASP